ncbi:ABC transporter substrate-binding protein [Beijerinckia sp. L45]|uniref:ABC transporter substrate-binding protein n=1 Tax=Beijerinckia sp. L45 TaxID=1641855 RepID=UPI00131CE3A0|nr:ABC transporter substrate-binding protein [Beijerinckia sp. L45]
MNRRTFTALAASTALFPMPSILRAQEKKQLVIAEPFHSIGYLPLYMAATKGFLAAEGLSGQVVALEGGGSSHTNAVLSGQAFAFIGGPEHDAFAKIKGGEMRAVANVVNRGNVYFVAKKGLTPGHDLGAFLKGRKIGTLFFGSTPNSITRYVVIKAGLALTDVTIVESTNAGQLALMKSGQIEIAALSEPQVTQGIRAGLWDEPFYSVPAELGPYAYSVMSVREESIRKDPETVAGFVRAMMKGLHALHDDPKAALTFAHEQFPTMPLEDVKATMDRGFADNVWSTDGIITEQGWATGKAVVMTSGLLKQDVPYDGIIDMQFVKAIK